MSTATANRMRDRLNADFAYRVRPGTLPRNHVGFFSAGRGLPARVRLSDSVTFRRVVAYEGST